MELALIPLLAGLIGWLTNMIAVKMLFHPRKPWRLLWIFPIQGVFPKRQSEVAKKVGELVSAELVSSHEIRSRAEAFAAAPEVTTLIESKLEHALVSRLPQVMPMAAMFLSQTVIGKVLESFRPDMQQMVREVAAGLGDRLENEFDVKQMVEDKVNNFSADKLEQILNGIMKREFRTIELLGGVLGFFIGVIQVAIVYF